MLHVHLDTWAFACIHLTSLLWKSSQGLAHRPPPPWTIGCQALVDSGKEKSCLDVFLPYLLLQSSWNSSVESWKPFSWDGFPCCLLEECQCRNGIIGDCKCLVIKFKRPWLKCEGNRFGCAFTEVVCFTPRVDKALRLGRRACSDRNSKDLADQKY